MLRFRFIALAALPAIGALAPSCIRAQDAHYWTQQYGASASLLGGAVIGSVEGFAATFYNPARLTLIEDQGFALSTQVFELESITVQDGAGPGVDLSTSRSGLEPSLVAGRFPFGGERDTWAYSLLTRSRVDNDVGTNLIVAGEELDSEDGLERVVGTVRFENDIRDTWGGVSWARRTSAAFSVGATMFGGYRSHNSRFHAIAESIDTLGVGDAEIDVAGHNYSTARVLWKLGVTYTQGKVDLGLTVTTPSVHLLGSGDVGANRGRFGDVNEPDQLGADLQSDLDASYKSPASIGVGGAWALGKTKVHGSAEWFDAIHIYDVISTGALNLEGDTVQVGITHATKSVLNWGVGAQHRFGTNVQGFVSVVTDRSAAPDESTAVGTARWDITVATLGADFGVRDVRFTLGAGLGFGNSPLLSAVDLLGVGDSPVLEDASQAKVRYRSWRFIFGFEL